jgi:chromate transport protein ChrA
MLWIILFALLVIGALAVLSFAVHMLFSPWLLLLAAGLLVWLTFRHRRSHR